METNSEINSGNPIPAGLQHFFWDVSRGELRISDWPSFVIVWELFLGLSRLESVRSGHLGWERIKTDLTREVKQIGEKWS